MDELQVTVIVHSAKDLQAHKKGDVCLASVVFGHGKDFYTTEVIEGSVPEWNQEACLSVSSHSHEPIKFKVKEREHTLGTIAVPVAGLSRSRDKSWFPLQPHKRASEAHGSLQLSCWVTTSVRDSNPTSSHVPSRARARLHHSSPICTPHCEVPGEDQTSDGSPPDEKKEERVPEVSGVSPNEGPVQGGQRVVLRGSYLGESRDDVMQVLVAGVDCTDSLEYFSPSKLAVVAGQRPAPGSGPVVVQTRTGGVGVSWINFSFVVGKDDAVAERQGRSNKGE
jgi:hypothetical protein